MFSKNLVRFYLFFFVLNFAISIASAQENPEVKNIYTLYKESQKMRITAKSKRLGNNHKLTKRLKKYDCGA